MKHILFLTTFMFLSVGSLLSQTELSNFENTWQTFIKNPQIVSISELQMPFKTNKPDYLKYCLMNANSYFCSENLADSKKMMEEIKAIGIEEYSKITGYKNRYEDLGQKIESYYKINALWQRFIPNRNVTSAELESISNAKMICEKGALCKFFYMSSYAEYCNANYSSSKNFFENRVLIIAEKNGSYDPKNVPALPAEISFMKEIIRVNNILDTAWANYIKTDVSHGFVEELKVVKCNVVPNIKIYILRAMTDICKNGNDMMVKIKELQQMNSVPLPADVQKKLDWLDKEVSKYNGNLSNLNKAWQEFNANIKISTEYRGIYCEKDAQIKSYIIEGTLDHCNKGEAMLLEIAKVQKEFNPTLDQNTLDKIKNLENLVNKEKEHVAQFTKAWEEFKANDTLNVNTKFPFEYCSQEMLVQSYIMDGRLGICSRGESRLSEILKIKKMSNFEGFAEITLNKFNDFEKKVVNIKSDNEQLNKLWSTFITNKDTILEPYTVAARYCDKIMQVKSWCLMGHLNTCAQGQEYLSKIDALQKKENLVYDKELACRVTRLRIKVWDCRYWELVEKAWALTHAEREDFGPKSAKVMYKDLNGPKQVCETKVEYEPLDKIGIKYTIKIYLCQNVDLAKMGDPEYYKKIAKWIDNEVLVKYCSPDYRCKKDFKLYIEGHTDGNPMTAIRYPESFNIPKGTPYTHFIGTKDTIQKVLDKTITYELKSNMELGLGRAWTVKKQLDFIGAPVTIGAYEHPANEKGGEYRRMEVELYLPNLLLDFFEAKLKELLDASGIGPQPKQCEG